MARQARKASVSGVYHVMLRGINRQRIFEDSQDEQKFLELLRLYQKRCVFALYGYCLMGNHVHLLLKEAVRPCVITINGLDVETGPGEALETVFKRIGSAMSSISTANTGVPAPSSRIVSEASRSTRMNTC
jgi:hypothetical protein